MDLTVIGCGDAFGSGGRLQTSFLIETAEQTALLDCGASTLIGLNRLGIDPGQINAVFISHLHGDHFAGLVWLLLHGQHPGRRTQPLTLIGPVGLEERLAVASEALFPGATKRASRFPITYREFEAGQSLHEGDITLNVFEGSHPSGGLSAALRLEASGRTLAFSGDTEWVEGLIDCAANADVFLTECYALQSGARYHLDWETLTENIDRISADRIFVSHMNAEMLTASRNLSHPRVSFLDDGLKVSI